MSWDGVIMGPFVNFSIFGIILVAQIFQILKGMVSSVDVNNKIGKILAWEKLVKISQPKTVNLFAFIELFTKAGYM